MSKVMCPGSYDPLTLGHVDVITRCAQMFDTVYVVIGYNEQKKGLLNREQRLEFAKDAFRGLSNVEVLSYDGLTVDFAFEHDCDLIVKGIRNSADLEYENEMSIANRDISLERHGKAIETLYMPSDSRYVYTSSSVVRKLLSLDLPVGKYVHSPALLYELLGRK